MELVNSAFSALSFRGRRSQSPEPKNTDRAWLALSVFMGSRLRGMTLKM
jgi:hypothetical protein